MKDEKKKLTSVSGRPIAENQNVETAGRRGPMLLQDFWYLEKLAHFDREVIPERRMHAKGSGAFGTFTVTHDISQYTKAKIFSQIGKKTDLFVRFSTVAGERGAADAERDIRGFAIKFYTEEGNWDLVGNNTPVFFMKDPYKFPDLNKAVKRDPKTNLRSANHNWDFWTLLPEALHQVTILMSERDIPKSFRHMHGFGSHTFSFINAKNDYRESEYPSASKGLVQKSSSNGVITYQIKGAETKVEIKMKGTKISDIKSLILTKKEDNFLGKTYTTECNNLVLRSVTVK